MTKRMSTLLTMGLLVAGSLFSGSAMAQDYLELPIGEIVGAGDFVSGNKYFVVQGEDKIAPASENIGDPKHYIMGFGNSSGKSNTVVDVTAALGSTDYVNVVSGYTKGGVKGFDVDCYLWTVTETKANNKYYYKFSNEATGRDLVVACTGDGDFSVVTDFTAPLNVTNSTFAFGSYDAKYNGEGQAVAWNWSGGNYEVNLGGGLTCSKSATGKVVLYAYKENTITAKFLNSAGNGSFSLDFGMKVGSSWVSADYTPFDGEMRAFTVSSVSGLTDGTYFATSWPSSLADEDKITTVDQFKQCTFVAMSPVDHWDINGLNWSDGNGFKWVKISGKKMIEDADGEKMAAGYVPMQNAAFTVTEKDPVNEANDYTLTFEPAWCTSKYGCSYGHKKVIMIEDQGELIVTNSSDEQNWKLFDVYVDVCQHVNSNLVSVDKILTSGSASVFNIKFASKTIANDNTTSEYNKYLGLNASGMLAQGSDFLNLDAPENQWIITNADKGAKTFTFQNRELSSVSFTTKLIKTGTNSYKMVDVSSASDMDYAYVDKSTGTYTVKNVTTALEGMTAEFTAVTVDPMAGYVVNEFDNAGLIRLVFTSNQKLIADNLYVASDATVSKNDADAAMWEIVKFDDSAAKKGTIESDTIYKYNDFAYYKSSAVKIASDGDKVAAVAFGFKLYGTEKYLGVKSNTLAAVDGEDNASHFLIKINKNGSYSMINTESVLDFGTIITAGKKALTVVSTSGKVMDKPGATVYYDYAKQVYDLSIVKDEPTPSYKHEPAFVALNATGKGYVAMDSTTAEGIVAPVSMLKSEYSKKDLTFKLDTADSEAYVPSFYISHRDNFMFNAVDSLEKYNTGTASAEKVAMYGNVEDNAKAIFRAATLNAADTLTTAVAGKETKLTGNALKPYKYQIVMKNADVEGEYIIKSVKDSKYLYNLNGILGFTSVAANALVVNVEESEDWSVANETIAAEGVKVIAGEGYVTVKGAAGKKVTVANVLGQTVADTTIASDEAQIAAPAGVVIVAVEGEAAQKAIVK